MDYCGAFQQISKQTRTDGNHQGNYSIWIKAINYDA
jgi:hypothetical protein